MMTKEFQAEGTFLVSWMKSKRQATGQDLWAILSARIIPVTTLYNADFLEQLYSCLP